MSQMTNENIHGSKKQSPQVRYVLKRELKGNNRLFER